MIKTHYFIVATNQQSQIVGFSSITHQGYLHSMFVHKDFQGKGIATILLNEIETVCNRKRNHANYIRSKPDSPSILWEKRLYSRSGTETQSQPTLSHHFWMAKRLAEWNRITDVFLLVVSFVVVVPYTQEKKSPCKGAEQNGSRCEKM